ncbi:hypothetical protein [Labedaea rhizosphaerae]|uniref:Uncharacterized protein n=1 Tax=Labedaea rhizosphaerae TaxID=598644 RepID=A0A4R6RW92_LABRH|nr:hypothetical protein [Labedaea rhizosphaerae]TDP91064.1 hypothetical protein EV186_10956 [Labedaea rhizosphaerae]
MSEPPYDPYRRQARPPRQPYQDPYQQPQQGGYQDGYQDDQYGYDAPRPPHEQVPKYQQPQRPYPPQRQQPQRQSPQRQPPRPPQQAPRRPAAPSGGGIKLPGIGLLLSVLGAIVQIVSFTLLPWIAATGGTGGTAKLYDLWKALSNRDTGGAKTFGDWYVVLFSYPTVILGILLAFAAVLESVAAKVLWAALALAGLVFLVVRYGVGPLAGIFGSKSAMHFSTVEIVVAVVALAAIVLIAFTLKTAIAMFRRIAGVILIVLSGVHLWAMTDLVKDTNVAELDFGAYGPSVGYLLIGIGALIGPRRLLPVG